jgi:2-polyprenyl-6-hydroxyphenyl methylase / 3-demethylubiquinone-9 3-methyltransferase
MNNTAPSINQEEVEKFSQMAEDWWNPHGKFKPLHKLNPVRLRYIRDTLTFNFQLPTSNLKPLQGLTILDIGCGGGLLSVPLTRLGATVTGIDAGEKNIAIAKIHAEKENLNIEYINTSAEDLAGTGRQFDVVLNMEVIEHVADVSSFMLASARLLKPNGLMLVATLNRTAKSYLFAIVGAEYVMRWLPRGTHDWQKFLKPHEIAEQFEKNGIKHLESKGVKYNPISDSFSLDENLDINFMMLGRKN